MNIIRRLILVLILILNSCKGQNNQEEKPLTGFNKVELVLDNEFITKDTITQKSTSFLNATTKQGGGENLAKGKSSWSTFFFLLLITN